MHILQRKILDLCDHHNLGNMKLREIGEFIGERHPQKIKHHLLQLARKGLIKIDKKKGTINSIRQPDNNTNFLSIPIIGAANCGEAAVFAEEYLEGHLRVSPKILTKKDPGKLFAIKAIGDSMNTANIDGRSIENGDFAIINSGECHPKNGDYILSIIDGVANIKRFIFDEENNQIVLLSESIYDFPPIYIHPDDKFMINGKVIQVIKKSKQ